VKGFKILDNKKGQTLVEFALIISLLLALLFGITEFGRGWYYSNALENGARAGARYASEKPLSFLTGGTVASYTFSQISSARIPVQRDVNTFISISAFNQTSGNGEALSSVTKGDAVQVIVRYNFEVLAGSIIPSFSGQKQIVRKATMYFEGN
jgi:Flp pilus assembly protein TadG